MSSSRAKGLNARKWPSKLKRVLGFWFQGVELKHSATVSPPFFLTATVCKIMNQVRLFRHVCLLKHYQFQNRKPSFIRDPFPKSPPPLPTPITRMCNIIPVNTTQKPAVGVEVSTRNETRACGMHAGVGSMRVQITGPRMRSQQSTHKRKTRQHSRIATWYFKERPIWTPLILLVKDERIWRRKHEKIFIRNSRSNEFKKNVFIWSR